MIYAITSDIHGRGKELVKCLEYVEEKRKDYPNLKVAVLGDYCDRGTDNLLTLDTIIDYKKKYPETITIMGNHDEFLIGSLWYNKLNKHSYLKELHSTPNSVYSIWTYHPNGGRHTYWELVHKCEDMGCTMALAPSVKHNKALNPIKKYIKFLIDNPVYVIENGIVFTHAPIPRWRYSTLDSIKNIDSYDVLWNVDIKRITNTDERYLNIHGHLHLNGNQAKIIEEGLCIDCATEPHVSITLIDTEKPFDSMIIDSYCYTEPINPREKLDELYSSIRLNKKLINFDSDTMID